MASEFVPVNIKRWSLFVQPDGPNTVPRYLGCEDLGDIDHALGDITQKFCPDPVNGGWMVTGQFQGEPSPATFDVSSAIGTTAGVLNAIKCSVPFYLVYVCKGQLQLFNNWSDLGVIAPNSIRTNNSWQTLRKRIPADNGESMKVSSWASDAPVEFFNLVPARQSITETEAINHIFLCNDQQCVSDCDVAKTAGNDAYLTTDAPAGSPSADADVWRTTDGGANWIEGIVDPFGPAEDIQGGVCVDLDSNITRVIVARGTTDAANPAEIAYSDDDGVTWTLVDVGSVNGQFSVGPNSMFSPNRDPNNVWLVTSGGYIYYSSDAGATWTAQEQGVITSGNYLVIHGSSENILYAGAQADVIVRSTDGGVSWTALTATGGGGEIQALWVLSLQRAWVGTDDATLWFTNDGGTTWTQRTGWAGDGVGEIKAIEFAPGNDLIGYMIQNNATPVGAILQTVNGGFNWRAITNVPTNTGLNDLAVFDVNGLYAVGEPGADGTGMVIKIENVT